MKEIGYLPLSRKIFEHEFWGERRTFSKFEAWVDLLQSARYDEAEKTEIIGGKIVKWKRGQLPGSLRFLLERWQWKSITRVENYLKSLVKEEMITLSKNQGINIITICKYDTYNLPKGKKTKGQQKGQGKGQGKGQINSSESEGYGQLKDSQKDTKKDSEKDETNKDLNKVLTSLHKPAICAFEENYKDRFKTAYVFQGGKDASAIKSLLKAVSFKVIENEMEPSRENILNGFKHLLESIKEDWVLRNYSPPVINAKFNDLFVAAKNGTTTGKKSDHSDYLAHRLQRERQASPGYP